MCAAKIGRADIGAMLLKCGAKHKWTDCHGWNARQIAELYDHRGYQELLVRVDMTEKQPVIKEYVVVCAMSRLICLMLSHISLTPHWHDQITTRSMAWTALE
jgi:hypothetical protein